MEVRQEFFDTNQPSTSGEVRAMPEIFKQLIIKSPMKKVSKLKYFFKIGLELIHDKYDVAKLTSLIEETIEDL